MTKIWRQYDINSNEVILKKMNNENEMMKPMSTIINEMKTNWREKLKTNENNETIIY